MVLLRQRLDDLYNVSRRIDPQRTEIQTRLTLTTNIKGPTGEDLRQGSLDEHKILVRGDGELLVSQSHYRDGEWANSDVLLLEAGSWKEEPDILERAFGLLNIPVPDASVA